MKFDGSESSDRDGNIQSYKWDFGDGNSVTIQTPDDPDVFHIYAGGGTFNVTLTVLDADSCTNSTTKLYIGLPYSLWTKSNNCAYLRDNNGYLEDKLCVNQVVPTPGFIPLHYSYAGGAPIGI